MPAKKPPKPKEKISPEALRRFLLGKTLTLDCGHSYTPHPWSNTLIITAQGKTYCHNCY